MENWPVLKKYTKENLRRIAMPMGGIGTGTVSLGGRGNLQDWAIMNIPAVGYTPYLMEGMRHTSPFFALFTETGERKNTIVLEGPLDSEVFEGAEGSQAPNHGLPRFRECSFEAAYPLAQVKLKDENVPLEVTLKAFNPLVPGDSDRSGIPTAILKFQLRNNTSQTVRASVCGTVINCIGADGRKMKQFNEGHKIYAGSKGNRNEFCGEEGLSGIFMTSRRVSRRSPAWGTMALSTVSDGDISYRTSWAEKTWGDSTLDFWDDFSTDGILTERKGKGAAAQMGSLAVKRTIAPGETIELVFFLTWHFPNRLSWNSKEMHLPVRTGNYYTTQYRDAWDAALKTARDLESLEEDTVRFVSAFCGSELPPVIKEAALFNISTLRTQTCFRTPDGRFFGWEGIHDQNGSCLGSCTHVWNYEQATAFLFGDLAQSMREVEFFVSLNKKNGHMNFRALLPLWLNRLYRFPAAADGQLGCIMKVYREWQLSGDNDFLKKYWPRVKKSLEFCWVKGGWDADRDGVMEGCQHNTMDVEYYGPNPQMQGWYLGALRAAEEMAEEVGERKFASDCRELFEKGSAYMDEELFNGEYYEHKIKVPDYIHPKLTHDMGAEDLSDPILQLGAGCLVDQLVGQYMAHILGLGYLADSEKIVKTLKSIMSFNFKEGFFDHFNHMRSYVLNDESALLMASYPRGNRPRQPFPYYNEVMTGFEHSTAAHMLYEGLEDEALKVIEAVRNRYDGYKRNPFDEAECGHHYARAMASWAQTLAFTGFQYSGVNGKMAFKGQEGRFFWSNGYAWGTCSMNDDSGTWSIVLEVLYGEILIRRFILNNIGEWTGKERRILRDTPLKINISQ